MTLSISFFPYEWLYPDSCFGFPPLPKTRENQPDPDLRLPSPFPDRQAGNASSKLQTSRQRKSRETEMGEKRNVMELLKMRQLNGQY